MTRAAVLVVLLGLLAGCATAPAERWVFDKPDVTDADRKRDQSQCFALAVDATTARPGLLMKLDREAYRACMEARGYRLRADARY